MASAAEKLRVLITVAVFSWIYQVNCKVISRSSPAQTKGHSAVYCTHCLCRQTAAFLTIQRILTHTVRCLTVPRPSVCIHFSSNKHLPPKYKREGWTELSPFALSCKYYYCYCTRVAHISVICSICMSVSLGCQRCSCQIQIHLTHKHECEPLTQKDGIWLVIGIEYYCNKSQA